MLCYWTSPALPHPSVRIKSINSSSSGRKNSTRARVGNNILISYCLRFGQSGKSWSDSTLSGPEQGVFKLRLESQSLRDPAQALSSLPPDLDIPLAEKISRVSSGSMTMSVSSTQLSLLSSTLTKLSEWAQDEIIPTPLPMTIRVDNVSLTIVDDNPPVHGCPQPPPVDFNIPQLCLTRDKSGVFSISSTTSSEPSSTTKDTSNDQDTRLRSELDLALAEVRILRAKLAAKDSKILELESKLKELSSASDRSAMTISNLVEEKKSLMDTLKYLQEELIKSGKK